MKKFWGCASNGIYTIGCTGQTVCVYDKNGAELAKFKDIKYGYTPMISPDGTLFVVKSTDGRLAVYSLETLTLLRKFRFSKMDGAQDSGFCFSKDGEFFLNIELQSDGLSFAISVYRTEDFSRISQLTLDDNMTLDSIEYDEESDSYFVLGWSRREPGYGFAARYEGNALTGITPISEKEYQFYRGYKHLELMGFTEKAFQWSYMDCCLSDIQDKKYPLAELFHKKSSLR